MVLKAKPSHCKIAGYFLTKGRTFVLYPRKFNHKKFENFNQIKLDLFFKKNLNQLLREKHFGAKVTELEEEKGQTFCM